MKNKEFGYFRQKSSVAHKFIVYILLFSAIVTIIGTSLQLYTDYSRDINKIQENMRQIETIHLNTIINSLWISDMKLLKIEMEGIVQMQDMHHVEIRHNNESIVLAGTRATDDVITKKFPLSYHYKNREIDLGILYATASLKGVYQRLIDRILIILATQAVKTLLVSMFIFFLFYHLVGRHLGLMAGYAQTLDSDHLDNPLVLNRGPQKQQEGDELEQLVFAINEMRDNLSRAITEHRQSAAEQLRLRSRYESLWALSRMIDIDQKSLCKHILADIVALTDSKYGFFGFLNKDETIMHIDLWSPEVMDDCRMHSKPLEFPIDKAGVWAKAIHQRKTVIINDYSKDMPLKKGTPEGHVEIKRMLSVPIFSGNRIVAIGCAANKLSDYTKDDAEQMNAFLQSAQLIIDKKAVESELRESEENLQATFNQAAVGIAHVGISGEWLRVNEKLCEIVGYTYEEMMGLTFQDITHPDDLKADLNYVSQLLENKLQTYTMEKRYIKKDGTQVWINLTVSLIRDILDKPKYFIAIIEDISQRKKAEDNLQLSVHQLEKANKELSDFAYIVSHDLKEPLRAVHSLAKWIIDDYADKFDDAGKENVYLLMGRVRRMNDLVEGILQYSRAGRLIGGKALIEINQIVSEVISILNPPEHIHITIQDTLPAVMCERTSMSQVFQNLLANAVKYMDKPEGEITISAVEEADFWKFCVSDNGPGIDRKDHEKIFQMFRVLQPRDKSEASGVGLAIVTKIIDMYGGKIWVESGAGKGSRFYFTIPR